MTHAKTTRPLCYTAYKANGHLMLMPTKHECETIPAGTEIDVTPLRYRSRYYVIVGGLLSDCVIDETDFVEAYSG